MGFAGTQDIRPVFVLSVTDTDRGNDARFFYFLRPPRLKSSVFPAPKR